MTQPNFPNAGDGHGAPRHTAPIDPREADGYNFTGRPGAPQGAPLGGIQPGYPPVDPNGLPPGEPAEPAPRRRDRVKKGLGAGSAMAISLVTSLVAGSIAGLVVSNVTSAAKNESLIGVGTEDNALEAPVEKRDAKPPEGSVEEVATAVLPAVVSISVGGRAGAEGSGSIISSDGKVLTNHHVIAGAADGQADIQVTLNDGSRHPATFIASDVNTDVGVIQIDGVDDLPVIKFGDSDALNVGQSVVAIGSPLGLSATVTTGIVSAKNRPVRASQGGGESSVMDGIQTDAAINPGNSGGPLVDMNGHLIGMNSVIASMSPGLGGEAGSIGLGFAIPSNFARRVANQLIKDGKATQPMMGVQVTDNIRGTDGALVGGVEPGGPADQAGLRKGDVIVGINDRLIESADALVAATRSFGFGETVTLKIQSGGDSEPRTVDVTLSSE